MFASDWNIESSSFAQEDFEMASKSCATCTAQSPRLRSWLGKRESTSSTWSTKMGAITMMTQNRMRITATRPMNAPAARGTPLRSSAFTIGDSMKAMSEPTARNSMTGASAPSTFNTAMAMTMPPTTVHTRKARRRVPGSLASTASSRTRAPMLPPRHDAFGIEPILDLLERAPEQARDLHL